MDYEDEQKQLLQKFKDTKKRETWSDLGNSVVGEIRATRLRMETRELGWRKYERFDADIEAGRVTRRELQD